MFSKNIGDGVNRFERKADFRYVALCKYIHIVAETVGVC